MKVSIKSIAYSLGTNRVDNQSLEHENPTWEMKKIVERTGVFSRPIALPDETALDLGERAVLNLFKLYPSLAGEIDTLIFCTQTPDYLLPGNAVLLHGRLGLPQNIMAFDISHACSGYIYGVGIGKSLIQSGMAGTVLLVTADTYSKLLHPEDRSTRPIFGDGAAATILSAGGGLVIIDMAFYTDGTKADRFIIESGGAKKKVPSGQLASKVDGSGRVRSEEHIYMDGLGVLSFFNSVVPKSVKKILEENNLSLDDVSVFLFHQASRLALEGIQKSLSIPKEKMIIDIEDTGNLVSSSIPVAFSRALKKAVIKPGQLVVVCGFGVGLSWGVSLIKYTEGLHE